VEKLKRERIVNAGFMRGNSRNFASEWEFHFVVSNTEKISDKKIEEFWEKILDVVDQYGFSLGGSYKPILDSDYENMLEEKQ
jgi:hypothetical protein